MLCTAMRMEMRVERLDDLRADHRDSANVADTHPEISSTSDNSTGSPTKLGKLLIP